MVICTLQGGIKKDEVSNIWLITESNDTAYGASAYIYKPIGYTVCG